MTTYKPTDQLWSWVYVMTGCLMVLTAKHFGVPTDIGAGIIGAGINAFTQVTRQQSTNVDHVQNMTQTNTEVETPKTGH